MKSRVTATKGPHWRNTEFDLIKEQHTMLYGTWVVRDRAEMDRRNEFAAKAIKHPR